MYRTGANYERELLMLFREAGFAGIRAAKSSCPDLVVGKAGNIIALECKYTRKEAVYLKAGEIAHMKWFSGTFGFPVLYAIKFGRRQWLLLDPNCLEKNTVDSKWAAARGMPLPSFLQKSMPDKDIK